MKAYKGFDKDLKCRDYQYDVGKTYETDEAKLCESGFHACEAPLNVFDYYPPTTSRYCEVNLDDVSDERGNDSKVVGKKITVGAEIGIPGLVKAHVEWVKEKAETASGWHGNAAASGWHGNAAASGDCGNAAASGDCGNAAASGWHGAAEVSGVGGVALASGYQSRARACLGSAIVICERGEWDGDTYPLISIKAAIVDGKRIKPDTWYTLKDGKFVKVEE